VREHIETAACATGAPARSVTVPSTWSTHATSAASGGAPLQVPASVPGGDASFARHAANVPARAKTIHGRAGIPSS
jgi:hypothetical protein